MSQRRTLVELEDRGEFARRHVGVDAEDEAAVLATLGLDSTDALLDAVVPEGIRLRDPLDLPAGRTEHDVLDELRGLARRNRVATSLIGMGYHGTITPPVIQRNLLENPAWYTAYTPYQPEISQGRLEALLNFQTMVADLTGMDLANASMLDEATAAAEAMAMCRRLSRSTSDVFVVDPDTHPQTIAVLRTARRAGRHRVGRRRGGRPERCGRLLRRAAVLPGQQRRAPRRGRVRRRRARPGRPRGRRLRPARARPPRLARRAWRRHRRRFGAALRRAHGLRWSPRRLPRHPRRVRPLVAGPPGGREHGPGGPSGAPTRPPDARAAHPTGEGDEQHLHGAGAPRQHRRDVRRVARAGRSPPHRGAGAPADLAPGGGDPGRRGRGDRGDLVRHRPGAPARPGRRRPRSRSRGWAEPAVRRRRQDRHQPGRDDHHRRDRAGVEGDGPAVGRHRGARCRRPGRGPGRGPPAGRDPEPPGVQPVPQRARAPALPASTRGQGPRARSDDDPARLVHHEAQRGGRDDPDHVARAGPHPSLRPRRPGRRLPPAHP